MTYLITGAGQIGHQLAYDISDVRIIRRSQPNTPDARITVGDAGDRNLLHQAAHGSTAIFHCIHTVYNPKSWRAELPHREQAVMDVAYDLDIPVIFPESTYAFGRGAINLTDDTPIRPCSPLGEVRAELLLARANHPARTISVVAGDLIGPTATTKGSVAHATVIKPARKGKRCWVLADPDAKHSFTFIPDLTMAMKFLADHPQATNKDIVLAPSPAPLSIKELAQVFGGKSARVSAVPAWPLAAIGTVSPLAKSLFQQQYLWRENQVIEKGSFDAYPNLAPTTWPEIRAAISQNPPPIA